MRPGILASSHFVPVAGGTTLPFLDDFTGSNGTAWASTKWTTSSTGTAGNIDIQSNAGRIGTGAGGSYAQVARAIATGMTATADADATGTIKFANTGEQYFKVWLRASGSWSASGNGENAVSGYYLQIADGGSGPVLTIKNHANTTIVTTTTPPNGFTLNTTTTWAYRFSVIGTTVRGKVWNSANAEPAGWDVTATDSSVTGTGVHQFSYTCGTTGAAVSATLDNIFAGVVYWDDFNRANTTSPNASGVGLGAGWTGPDWFISGNKATRGNAGGNDYAVFLTSMGKADMFAEVDASTASTSYSVVNVRRTNDNAITGYLGFMVPGGSLMEIGKEIGGSYTTILQGASSSTGTGRIRLEVQGTALRLYLNGVLVLSTTDSSVTTGNYAGLNANQTAGGLFDNFACGPL